MLLILNNELTNALTSIVALVISIIALIYTIRAFLLKSGHKIRCDITTCSSIECDDNYVSSITLENLKDRASVIFKIYLQLGRSNFLLIEDFTNKPLILKPFEVYYKEYDPIILYSCSMTPVKLDKVLNNKRRKFKILLATTDGKYVVKTNTKYWDPIKYFFRNYFTALIDPIRITYDGKSYGGNIKYLVKLKKENKEQIIQLQGGDENRKIFKRFSLTSKSLSSKKALESFLRTKQKKGLLVNYEIEVIDIGSNIAEIKSEYKKDPYHAVNESLFKYEVIGRIQTIIENIRLKRENRKIRKEQQKKKINTAHNRVDG